MNIIIIIFISLFIFANTQNNIRGVNIGGWLVLEPWITPSIFYNSFGLVDKFPIDMYSFCDYYEPEISNQIYRTHIDNWISESEIKLLVESGINLLRVPIGDWTFNPYGPYAKKSINNIQCTSGSEEKIDWIFRISKKYNLKILLDLHGIKGSQNGFDNSGYSGNIEVKSNKYIHWSIRTADWIGEYNIKTKSYKFINQTLIDNSVETLKRIIKKYSNNFIYSNLYGIEVINEPWENTPEEILKNFYQQTYNIFIEYMNEDKVFVIHDSFRSDIWADFQFIHTKNPVVIDTHQYTAWNQPYESFEQLVKSGYQWQKPKSIYPYIVGEFSLAIDNCEMWLNGFMDNLDDYPLYSCTYITCPKTNLINNKNLLIKSINGPFGTGISYPNPYTFKCPTTINFTDHFNLDNKISDYDEKSLAKKVFYSKIFPFQNQTNGWIFWNFKTESDNYQWNLIKFLNMTQIKFNNLPNLDNANNLDLSMNLISNKFKIIFLLIFSFTLICFIIVSYKFYIYNMTKLKTNNYVDIETTEFIKNIDNMEYVPKHNDFSNIKYKYIINDFNNSKYKQPINDLDNTKYKYSTFK